MWQYAPNLGSQSQLTRHQPAHRGSPLARSGIQGRHTPARLGANGNNRTSPLHTLAQNSVNPVLGTNGNSVSRSRAMDDSDSSSGNDERLSPSIVPTVTAQQPEPSGSTQTINPSSIAGPAAAATGQVETHPTKTRRRSPRDDDAPRQRAPQACERCRRMKLRCVGGDPCRRCKRAVIPCGFGARPVDDIERSPTGIDPAVRLSQLEKAITSLIGNLSTFAPDAAAMASALTGLQGSNQSSQQFQHPQLQQPSQLQAIPSSNSVTGPSAFDLQLLPETDQAASSFHHIGLTSTGFSQGYLPPTFGTSASPFTSSTGPTLPSSTSPADAPQPIPARTVRINPLSTEIVSKNPSGSLLGSRNTPEGRLAVAQSGAISLAPFQPLLFRPAVWDNREQSRPGSPTLGGSSRDDSWSVFEARAGPADDPVSEGIVDFAVADVLFNL